MASNDIDDLPTGRMGIPAGAVAAAPNEGVPRLVVLMGSEPGRRHTLQGKASVIGRSEEADIQVDDSKVSRKHVRIRDTGERWVVEDLESRNGTLLNGKELDRPRVLAVGDRIQLSAETLLLFTRQDPLEDLLLHRQQMEVIGHLAAGIAHDFNNLLNVIEASTAHLAVLDAETPLSNEGVAECHADIRAASRRAAELTARLLTIAGRRDGKKGDDGVVDVSALCADVLQLVRRTFGRSIEIEADIASGLSVRGDHAALHQVLMNLCINARDAMREGGTLGVLARSEEGPEGSDTLQVVLSVSDTGMGMDDKTRERVFEPFFTTKARGAGSGLGLSTVYEVATSHGGTVDVESSPGSGSTFRVRLPQRETRTPGRSPRIDRRASTWDSHAPVKQNGRVLVVDDQELVRRSLGRLLEAQGHDVLYAGDGLEALARYEESDPRPDVVLMDLDMPRLSGGEALVRLRELDPSVRVVLISGFYDETHRQQLIREGAVDLLAKPIDIRELAQCIRVAMGAPAGAPLR